MIDKYAIYLRKSRSDKDLGEFTVEEVLERHKNILLDLAVKKGLYIEKVYVEGVVSGETIKDRPIIQELINDCYKGKYAGVLVVEITRLSRGNQGDAQTIIDCFTYANNNKGVLVITPTKTYDIANNTDDLEYMEFELFMSRREYKMIKKRMDRGRKQAVVEGNFMGSYRPYGYDILKTKTGRTLIPNEDEAPIVKMIFDMTVNQNKTAWDIAKHLTALGVPTYLGADEWSRETVKTILTNPTYIGKVRWNDRMQVKTMKDGELVTSRPRSNHTDQYMEYEGKHKKYALVDEETFKAAGSKFHSDRTKGNLKLINPLAGLLVCQKCGKTMGYHAYKHMKGKTSPRYNHKQSQVCKVKSVVADDLMDALIHALKLYIEDFQMKVDNLPDMDENALTMQIQALEKEYAKVKKKLAKAFDDYEEGIYTSNEFVERKTKHNARLEEIQKKIIELEESIPEKEEYEEKIIMFSEALETLKDKTLDADIKNVYLKRIINRIEFSRENDEEFILDVFLN